MTQKERLSAKVLSTLCRPPRDTRAPFRVGRLSGSGNGQLDPGDITYCRDIQHALNVVRLLSKDHPHVNWVIRPKQGKVWTNPDIDALVRHGLMVG
jgi:hypothetical protein